MSFSKWEIRPADFNPYAPIDSRTKYEIYRVESGGVFNSREDAEHLAYELNKEADDGADK